MVAELKALLAKATPGPWVYRVQHGFHEIHSENAATTFTASLHAKAAKKAGQNYINHGHCTVFGCDVHDTNEEANAALIVDAVNALPTLLADLETMREALEPFAAISTNLHVVSIHGKRWALIDEDVVDLTVDRPDGAAFGWAERLEVKDLRRAAAALQPRKAKP